MHSKSIKQPYADFRTLSVITMPIANDKQQPEIFRDSNNGSNAWVTVAREPVVFTPKSILRPSRLLLLLP